MLTVSNINLVKISVCYRFQREAWVNGCRDAWVSGCMNALPRRDSAANASRRNAGRGNWTRGRFLHRGQPKRGNQPLRVARGGHRAASDSDVGPSSIGANFMFLIFFSPFFIHTRHIFNHMLLATCIYVQSKYEIENKQFE